jgi:hypothetical protein
MNRKWILMAIICIPIACGADSEKKNHPIITEEKDNRIYDYEWHEPILQYEGKKIAMYGFMWFDTILNKFPVTEQIIFEKPNCASCNRFTVTNNQELLISEIDDTTVERSSSGQWRLVKAIGTVDTHKKIYLEQLERAEYSYPDYENSGYRKLTREWFQEPLPGNTFVYVDGYVQLSKGTRVLSGDYIYLQISSTELKEKIGIFIKGGTLPNQMDKDAYRSHILKVKDENGEWVNAKKVRVYGLYQRFDNHPTGDPVIFVEMITLLS